MSNDKIFWQRLDSLLERSKIVIDRPRGSHHPRFPEIVYVLDYGYLDGTSSNDGEGIDVWLGSDAEQKLEKSTLNVFITSGPIWGRKLLGDRKCKP